MNMGYSSFEEAAIDAANWRESAELIDEKLHWERKANQRLREVIARAIRDLSEEFGVPAYYGPGSVWNEMLTIKEMYDEWFDTYLRDRDLWVDFNDVDEQNTVRTLLLFAWKGYEPAVNDEVVVGDDEGNRAKGTVIDVSEGGAVSVRIESYL